MGYTYRNPASSTAWFDEFVQVIDEAYDHKVIILLLVDFNMIYVNPDQPARTLPLRLFFIDWLQAQQE